MKPLLVALLAWASLAASQVLADSDRLYTVVALGDSTTAPRGRLKTYAQLLQAELRFPGRTFRVLNAGGAGNTSEEGRARLTRDVLAHKPDLVIIQFGINDASVEVWKTPPATRPRLSLDQYAANLREMVKTIQRQGAAVILMTPNPMRWTTQLKNLYGKPPYKPDDPDGFNVLLKNYAARVRQIARQEKTPLVDVYAAFEKHGQEKGQSVEDLLLDGMHPNDKGHRLVADRLLVAIQTDKRESIRSFKLLLVGSGPDGHPVQTHEYMAGLKVLARCLKDVPGVEITTVRADEPWKEGPELIARADGVVLFLSEGARWMNHDPKRREALTKMAARGGGIVALHWAMGTKDAKNIESCLQLLGGCHGGPDRKYKVLETDAVIADRKHPIAAGVKDFHVRDEFYYRLKFVKAEKGVQQLLSVTIDGQPETVAWCWERPDGGRSFGFSGLHFHDNWRLPEYRRLAAQGVMWALKKPIPKDGLPVEVTEDDLKLK